MSDFKYDDVISETPEEIEPVTEEVAEELVLEEVEQISVVEEVVEETPKPKKKAKKEDVVEESPKTEMVALFSTKTVFWEGIGQIKRGYNIVNKEQAEKWVTRNHIRVATPEEIIKELNG